MILYYLYSFKSSLEHIISGNRNYSFLLGLLVIGLITPRLIAFFAEYGHLLGNNDRYYYLAVADSIFELGRFANYKFDPPEPLLNSQVGVIFAYSLYRLFTFSYENLFLTSSIVSTLLFLSSLFPLKKLHDEVGLNKIYFIFSVLILLLLPYYLSLIHSGQTEGYFYPLVIWWSYIAWKWVGGSGMKLTVLLLAFSLLLYLFRMQSLLVFGSFFLTLAIFRKWKHVAVFSAIVLVSVGLVSVIINLVSIGISYGGETGHFANIFSISGERIWSFRNVFHSYVTQVGSGNFGSMVKLFFSIPFWTVFLVAIGYNFNRLLKHPIPVYAFLVFLSALTALLLFREDFFSRYVLYSIPFFVLFFLSLIKVTTNIYLRHIMVVISFAWIAVLSAFFVHSFMARSASDYELVETRLNALDTLQKITDEYEPDHVYTDGYMFTYRVIYTGTRIPIKKQFHPDQINPNSIIVIRSDTDNSFYRENYHNLGSVTAYGEHFVYYNP